MTEFSDQEVVAFVDRQMDDKARAAFEAQLRIDETLARRVAAHGWIARQIVMACGSPPEVAADSAQLEQLGLGPGNTGPIRPAVLSRQTGRARWAAGITAIAASLAIGFFGGLHTAQPGSQLLTQWDGKAIAADDLAWNLSHKLSGESGQIQIGMTFRTAKGLCRSFKTSGLSGIGCLAGRQWTVPILVESKADQPTGVDYQVAGGSIAPAVMAEIDRSIEGEPLTLTQEREVLGRAAD